MKYICPKCKKAVRIDWRKPWFKGKKSLKSFCDETGDYVRLKLVIK
jgi:hypothetical protein